MDKTSTFESMAVEVTTGGALATVYIGVYSDYNGRPDRLLYVSDALDAATSNNIVTSTQSMTFNGGTPYWTAVLVLTAAATLRTVPLASVASVMGFTNSAGSTTAACGYQTASLSSLATTAPTVATTSTSARPALFFLL